MTFWSESHFTQLSHFLKVLGLEQLLAFIKIEHFQKVGSITWYLIFNKQTLGQLHKHKRYYMIVYNENKLYQDLGNNCY